MSIYVLLVWGFANLDFYEARFKALLGEILVFRPFLAYMASWMAF